MSECGHAHDELVALLRDDLPAARRRRLRERVEGCEACAAELRSLTSAWEALPGSADARPGVGVREGVLTYAREAVEAPAPAARSGGVADELWRAVRPVVLPAGAGVAAAAAVVAALQVSGALVIRGHLPVLALGLALAALLSGAVGGLWTNASRRTSRAILLGGLGSLGGYLALSLLHPIPSTVEFCQLRIFRDPAMSTGQVCLVYAGVAALYAGLPVGVTAYLSPTDGTGWRIGLAEAAVFTLLALPVLGLQFGLEDAAVTATVLAGLALGAAAGGLAGATARSSRAATPAGV